jgi:hypothetical protein
VFHAQTKTEAWAHMETSLPLTGWILHPVLLDAAFQVALSLMDSGEERPTLPTSVARIHVVRSGPIGNSLRAHVVLKGALCVDITLADADGVVVELKGN